MENDATTPQTLDRCLTPRQLAAYWKCAPKKVRELIRKRQLRAFIIGKSVRISPDAISEYEDLHAVRPIDRRRRRRDADVDAEILELLGEVSP